tara:strand:- start:294 stop:401 length:108 start_codon:yes stop_codon:yes gene_type:complete
MRGRRGASGSGYHYEAKRLLLNDVFEKAVKPPPSK